MRQLSKQAAPCKSLWHYLLTRRICHKLFAWSIQTIQQLAVLIQFCFVLELMEKILQQRSGSMKRHKTPLSYRFFCFFFMIPWALFYTGQLLHLSKFKISSLAVTFKSAKKYISHNKSHEKDTTEGLVGQAPRSQGTLPQFPFSCSKPASTSGLPLSSSHRSGSLGWNWTWAES